MGDSKNPASRKWTWLYLCNREKPSEKLEIITEKTSPMILTGYADLLSNLIMRSYSEDSTLAARTAFYLATFTGGQVALKPDDPFSRQIFCFHISARTLIRLLPWLAHKPVPSLIPPKTLHIQISPLENFLCPPIKHLISRQWRRNFGWCQQWIYADALGRK